MRERQLILQGSPCDANFHEGGPQTIAESKSRGREYCPHVNECGKGILNKTTGNLCALQLGVRVAQQCLKQGRSIEQEMSTFRREVPHPAKGFIWSSDRKTFTFITDHEEAVKKVQEFAEMVLGGRKTEVGSGFEDVMAHVTTPEGIDTRALENLEGRFGGKCDVTSGPCSCGAWH